jgi:class 3 adenylate cyclase
MPIFMDRHDMRDMTAEQMAEAHRKDLEIQDQYGVKYLTYWSDSERCTGFCLVKAPDAATAAHVHREAHGEIASEIIPVDLATAEAFLGRISDPRLASSAPAAEMEAGLRAVMVTDIVGSTELTARLGDLAALELVRVHDALIRRGLALHHGREVKHTGDGIMAAFDNIANAVGAAADIQRRFCEYNLEASEDLRIRIGIDVGEPVSDQKDLFGATVQLAFRLCSEAEADGILVSEAVRGLCGQELTRFVGLGERHLKGFPKTIRLFGSSGGTEPQARDDSYCCLSPSGAARFGDSQSVSLGQRKSFPFGPPMDIRKNYAKCHVLDLISQQRTSAALRWSRWS